MPFISSGKANIRYILIVVILAIAFGALLIAYLNFTDEPMSTVGSFFKSIRKSTAAICDINNACPQGQSCYKFEGEQAAICWTGDPCQKCSSKTCSVAESFPMQVFCK